MRRRQPDVKEVGYIEGDDHGYDATFEFPTADADASQDASDNQRKRAERAVDEPVLLIV